MKTKCRDRSIDRCYEGTTLKNPVPVFIVHSIVEILLKESYFFHYSSRPKDLGLDELPFLPPNAPKVYDFSEIFD
jgi:hypothetical protein